MEIRKNYCIVGLDPIRSGKGKTDEVHVCRMKPFHDVTSGYISDIEDSEDDEVPDLISDIDHEVNDFERGSMDEHGSGGAGAQSPSKRGKETRAVKKQKINKRPVGRSQQVGVENIDNEENVSKL